MPGCGDGWRRAVARGPCDRLRHDGRAAGGCGEHRHGAALPCEGDTRKIVSRCRDQSAQFHSAQYERRVSDISRTSGAGLARAGRSCCRCCSCPPLHARPGQQHAQGEGEQARQGPRADAQGGHLTQRLRAHVLAPRLAGGPRRGQELRHQEAQWPDQRGLHALPDAPGAGHGGEVVREAAYYYYYCYSSYTGHSLSAHPGTRRNRARSSPPAGRAGTRTRWLGSASGSRLPRSRAGTLALPGRDDPNVPQRTPGT